MEMTLSTVRLASPKPLGDPFNVTHMCRRDERVLTEAGGDEAMLQRALSRERRTVPLFVCRGWAALVRQSIR